MRPKWNVMQSFFEVISFRVFSGSFEKFGQNPSHPKKLPALTLMKGYGLSGLAVIAKGRVW